MRILHLDLGVDMRGGQYQVLLLLRYLKDYGISSTLMARPPLLNQAELAGFSCLKPSRLDLWRLSKNYDLLHAHDARSHTWAFLFSRCPFVVSRRVAFTVRRSLASKWKYSRARRFLAVSEFVSQRLRSAGIPASKIDVVYDAVEPSAVELPRIMAERNRSGPVVALATRDPAKGRDLAEQAALPDIAIKFSDNLAADLNTASAFLYISRSEGFGSAALLAMSKGVPVIASRIEGLKEAFENEISGLSVENEVESIRSALLRLRADEALAQKLIANGLHRVNSLFRPESTAEKTVAAYRRALAF